jgi:uncharacterized membrane protein YkvA (DUF1232 family)
MRVETIRQSIAAAIELDNRTQLFASMLRQWAAMHGVPHNAQDVANTVTFCQQYASHVPTVLEEAEKAARKAGIYNEFAPMLEVVEQYWFEPFDVLPDHQGLVGIMDDAYVALSVVQLASLRFQKRTGRPLISMDLIVANVTVRALIGEPFASQLDAIVAQALNGATMQAWFNAMMTKVAAFPLDTPDPIWGNTSIEDRVKTQLGAIGIF